MPITFLDGPSFIMMGLILISRASSLFLCWTSSSSLKVKHSCSKGLEYTVTIVQPEQKLENNVSLTDWTV